MFRHILGLASLYKLSVLFVYMCLNCTKNCKNAQQVHISNFSSSVEANFTPIEKLFLVWVFNIFLFFFFFTAGVD